MNLAMYLVGLFDAYGYSGHIKWPVINYVDLGEYMKKALYITASIALCLIMLSSCTPIGPGTYESEKNYKAMVEKIPDVRKLYFDNKELLYQVLSIIGKYKEEKNVELTIFQDYVETDTTSSNIFTWSKYFEKNEIEVIEALFNMEVNNVRFNRIKREAIMVDTGVSDRWEQFYIWWNHDISEEPVSEGVARQQGHLDENWHMKIYVGTPV